MALFNIYTAESLKIFYLNLHDKLQAIYCNRKWFGNVHGGADLPEHSKLYKKRLGS